MKKVGNSARWVVLGIILFLVAMAAVQIIWG